MHLFLLLTPIISFLRPLEIDEKPSGIEHVDAVYVINLDERPDRWNRLSAHFNEKKILPNRVAAINGWKIPKEERKALIDPRTPRAFTGGEIGCLLSHISIYQDALLRDFDIVWICEDDIELQKNPTDISQAIEELTNFDPDWDLLYTDYTPYSAGYQFHRPEQSRFEVLNIQVTETIQRTHSRFGTHSMIFSKAGLMKVWDYFSNFYLWSPIDVDIHYVPNLREYSIRKNYTKVCSSYSDTVPYSPLSKLENK